MKRHHKDKLMVSAIVVFFVLALAVILIATKIYPIAIVGGEFISAKTWQEDAAIAKKIDPNSTNQQAMDQLIKVREEQQLLARLGVAYGTQNFSDESKFLTSGKEQEYQDTLQKYFFGDPRLFMEFLVEPQVYSALLRARYNSDLAVNTIAYSRAQDLLSQINQGKSFEELAKTQSDDKITGQLGGDLGFISEGQILPELWRAVEKSAVGQVNKQIIVSRLGYHIIYPAETAENNGEKVWHVKHILIKTEGYESWLNARLGDFTVWRFIK